MRAIVGLGNPGERYEDTRHNAGFQAVEKLAAEESIRIRSREGKSRVGRGTIAGESVMLVLPQTYMNASGEAVRALCEQNGIGPDEICVVFDDIDLPLGLLRMRARGSAGGQKGMKSIIERLGTTEFARLRVGVRGERYSRERNELGDYVLEPFARGERELFETALERAVESLRTWLTEGTDAAMRIANRKPSSPGSDRPGLTSTRRSE
ncbi:MAG TPA: aminoacyl-tRNA hydrolase [Thermoanaerobaculia bacterium]|nr:aminoacyl-tRNA hydrolase [Thermoanaerobaculia bacterium]